MSAGRADVSIRFATEQDPDMQRRDNHTFQSVARIKPDATHESTRAAMAALAARVAKDQPQIRGNITMEPTPVMEALLGENTPRMQRKNADRDDGCTQFLGLGTDLNRNFLLPGGNGLDLSRT